MVWTTGNDKYNAKSLANDIILVKLAKSLTFNANVQPACLPAANFFPDKKPAVVSGWGMLKWDGSEQQTQGINKPKIFTNDKPISVKKIIYVKYKVPT